MAAWNPSDKRTNTKMLGAVESQSEFTPKEIVALSINIPNIVDLNHQGEPSNCFRAMVPMSQVSLPSKRRSRNRIATCSSGPLLLMHMKIS